MVRHVDSRGKSDGASKRGPDAGGLCGLRPRRLRRVEAPVLGGRHPLPRSGPGPYLGGLRGRRSGTRLFQQSSELTGGTLRIDLHDVLANDEHVVSLVTMRAERAGKKLDTNFVQVSHVGDGKITETWICPADPVAMEEFWS